MNESSKQRALNFLRDFFRSGKKSWFVLEELNQRNVFSKREAKKVYMDKLKEFSNSFFWEDPFAVISGYFFLRTDRESHLEPIYYFSNKHLKRVFQILSRTLNELAEVFEEMDREKRVEK